MAENTEINTAINLMDHKNPHVVLREKVKEKTSLTKEETDENDAPECAVCLQPRVHPAELPCHHVFCYLCVKGVANQSKKCPMCRHDIPPDFLDRPRLVEFDDVDKSIEPAEEEFRWFYEGRNGWWQYDRRTSSELELAFKEGARSCELLIAGFLYVADFALMLQLRKNDPSRRRKIKRDSCNIPKKGVAGLRFNEHEQPEEEPIVREIRGAERPATPIVISDNDDNDDDDDDDDDESDDYDYQNENEDHEKSVGTRVSTHDTT